MPLVALLSWAASVLAADATKPHYHDGKMLPYEIGPPSILLSKGDEERLQAGETLMQAIVQEDGVARRLVMVKDIKAPQELIFGRIMDLEAYPRMVKGCDRTTNYHVSETPSGMKTVKTKYEIHALHLHFTYFMTHTYSPQDRCMIFNLDYTRRSDIDDSVGYWFVRPAGARLLRDCRSRVLPSPSPAPLRRGPQVRAAARGGGVPRLLLVCHQAAHVGARSGLCSHDKAGAQAGDELGRCRGSQGVGGREVASDGAGGLPEDTRAAAPAHRRAQAPQARAAARAARAQEVEGGADAAR